MSTTFITNDVSVIADQLFTGLSSKQRRSVIERTPFSMIDGAMGDAYTASCMYYYTQDEKWWNLLLSHTEMMVDTLRTHRFDQEGLLGGLSGIAYLLNASKRSSEEFVSAVQGLTGRITVLVERRMLSMSNRVGVRREDYDFAQGIAGTAHFLFSVGEAGFATARRICDWFAQMSTRSFPENFWTSSIDLDEDMIRQNPELNAGMRDLGLAHGIGAVIATLKKGYEVFQDPRYLTAAKHLCDAYIVNMATHEGKGISFYETPSFDGELSEVIPSPIARQAWCYGTPSMEVAIAGCPELEHQIYSTLSYGEDYFDPDLGHFNEPGVCHGIPSRWYIAEKLNLPCGDNWKSEMQQQINDFLHKDANESDLSFWHGIGGTLAVWFAAETTKTYAPALEILGV